MSVEIRRETPSQLADYARIPIAFEVRSVFECSAKNAGSNAFVLTERAVEKPWWKDYDCSGEGGPESWPARFDLSKWALFGAWTGEKRVGGAAIAFDPAILGANDVSDGAATLWDIRVAPGVRRRGVGEALFTAAAQSALENGCTRLQAETQNINVPACRFYSRQGCILERVNREAYPELPDELQLIWVKSLPNLA